MEHRTQFLIAFHGRILRDLRVSVTDPVASLGNGTNVPSACASPHADTSGRKTPSETSA